MFLILKTITVAILAQGSLKDLVDLMGEGSDESKGPDEGSGWKEKTRRQKQRTFESLIVLWIRNIVGGDSLYEKYFELRPHGKTEVLRKLAEVCMYYINTHILKIWNMTSDMFVPYFHMLLRSNRLYTYEEFELIIMKREARHLRLVGRSWYKMPRTLLLEIVKFMHSDSPPVRNMCNRGQCPNCENRVPCKYARDPRVVHLPAEMYTGSQERIDLMNSIYYALADQAHHERDQEILDLRLDEIADNMNRRNWQGKLNGKLGKEKTKRRYLNPNQANRAKKVFAEGLTIWY